MEKPGPMMRYVMHLRACQTAMASLSMQLYGNRRQGEGRKKRKAKYIHPMKSNKS